MMHLNAFLFGAGHHNAAWRLPGSPAERLGDIRYWEELARLSERGRLDAVFFADGHSVSGVEHGPSWFLEPLTALSAMARATERIGLVTTVSTTFFEPFHAARMLASLDHISGGRAGWNVVTSMFDAEARNHGLDAFPDHETRYARAHEFTETVLGLWDTWADGAVLADRAAMWADPSKVRPLGHRGERFRVDGPLTVPRPPQGRPVLFQAGASEQGRELTARFAEAVYAVAWDLESGLAYTSDVKARIAAAGRDPSSVAVMPGLVTYLGRTEEEARAKQERVDRLLPVEHSLRQLGTFVQQDCTGWDLDAPVPPLPPLEEFTGPKGRYATVLRIIETERPTLRRLLGFLAAGGGHATMIGTPEQVADRMEEWVSAGAADGFNLMPPVLPDSLEDVVELLVPELQRRGLFRREYEGSTLREHLGLARPGSPSHPSPA